MTQGRLCKLLAFAIAACSAGDAVAGGMELPVRGVRDTEQAGALIAGSDDADSLWINPAGLGHLTGDHKISVLVDLAYVNQYVHYTRIDSGGNSLPRVDNQADGLPIPTIAVAYGLSDRLVVAAGIAAPYAGLGRYSPTGPQRYASVSLDGSQFIYITVGAAYQLTDQLRIGATVSDVYSKIISQVVLGSCPGETVCAPEDPEFDAAAQDKQTDLWSPTGSVGLQYDFGPHTTLGLAATAPSKVSATGTLDSRLPSSAFFDGAMVVGNQSTLALTLPATLHGGLEVKPIKSLRVEAALDVELWSEHKDITITPHDISIQNAAGVGTYVIGGISIPRHYKNSYAPAIGVEWHTDQLHGLTVGAGYSYETAAAPKGYVSVLTVDSAKHIIGVGGGVDLLGWRLGGSFGLVELADVHVSLADAKVVQLTPIRDQPSLIPVNAGAYQSHYVIAGLRVAKQF